MRLFIRNNHGDTLVASYYHLVKHHSGTAVGAELSHSFSRNESTLIFGSQHSLDPHTIVKARFNNYGMASALVQHEWRPKSFITISGEVDTKAIEKSTKVGLSLVLKHWGTGCFGLQDFPFRFQWIGITWENMARRSRLCGIILILNCILFFLHDLFHSQILGLTLRFNSQDLLLIISGDCDRL